MAWGWSHTHEAYAYAREQIHNLPLPTLLEIYAEWRAKQLSADRGRSTAHWFKSIRHALTQGARFVARRGTYELAETVWLLASEQATCTNGGWEAWVCPHGCGCHMVPFGPDEE